MTIAYLNKNATSVADANWSDTSGFSATYPTLVVNDVIGNGRLGITGDVDKSGITEGVFSFDIHPGAVGILGTPSNPLIFDADNESSSAAGDQASARVTNYGSGVVLHYNAGGDESTAGNVSVGTGNSIYMYGGTATNVGQTGGYFEANQSTVITNYDAYGGRSKIEYNATAITLFRATGGVHEIYRKVTTFELGDGATVYYRPDKQITSFASTKLDLYGGRFVPTRGAIPTVNALGGIFDMTQLAEETAYGATAFNLGGARIIDSDFFDSSNVTNLYGTKRPVGGPAQLD